ncbi:hypothetical protein Ancab_016335 [Ancistrocladus abbreviatus]
MDQDIHPFQVSEDGYKKLYDKILGKYLHLEKETTTMMGRRLVLYSNPDIINAGLLIEMLTIFEEVNVTTKQLTPLKEDITSPSTIRYPTAMPLTQWQVTKKMEFKTPRNVTVHTVKSGDDSAVDH